MESVILASESPRRKELLEKLVSEFVVIPSNLAEFPAMDELPNTFAVRMAMEKATKVAEENPSSTVIGADTVVALNDRIMGKPSSQDEAGLMLGALSGQWHEVWTGLCLMNVEKNIQEMTAVRSEVLFRELNTAEIEEYVATGEPMDKAGSYAIQGGAKMFVKQIKGSYHNIVGLPTLELSRLFLKIGLEIDSASLESLS